MKWASSESISHTGLAKLFTWEFFISAVIVVFTAGMLWKSIEGEIVKAQEVAADSAEKTINVEHAVNEIKTDVAVIKENQKHAQQMADSQAEELAEQRRDIKTILRLVAGDKYERH